MGRPWFEVWLSENLGSMGFSVAPRQGNQAEVQAWEVRHVNRENGTMVVNADDYLSLTMKMGYRSGSSTLFNQSGSGIAASSPRYSSSGDQVEENEEDIIESYEEGDQIAVAVPAGEIGKAFIIKKLAGIRAVEYVNFVVSNGQD